LPCLAEPRTVAWGGIPALVGYGPRRVIPFPRVWAAGGGVCCSFVCPGAAAWRDRRMTAYDQLGGSSGAAAVSGVRVRRWADCP